MPGKYETKALFLDAAISALEQAVVTIDNQLVFGYVNRAAALFLGLPEGEVPAPLIVQAVEKLQRRVVNSDDVQATTAQLIINPHSVIKESIWIFPQAPTHIRVSSSPFQRNGISGRVWLFDDISGVKRTLTDKDSADTALTQRGKSEQCYQIIFDQAPLGIALIDSLTGRIRYANRRFGEIAGRPHGEMSTIDWMEITHPDDVQPNLEQMARLNAGKISGFKMNKRYLKPDGSMVWISMTVASVTGETGATPHHLCMIEDITEQVQAELMLTEASERLKLATNAANVGVWTWVFKENRLEWDERLLQWYAVPEEVRESGLYYQFWYSRIHPADAERFEERLREARYHDVPYEDEYRIVLPDGSVHHIHSAAIVEHDTCGTPLRMVGINRNITERKLLEEEREQYFKLFNTSSDLMCITENGYFKKINPAGIEMLGYGELELMGHRFIDFVHPDDLQATEDEVDRQFKRGFTLDFENRYVRKDGSVCWFSWQAFYSRGEELTYATGRDITVRKQYEHELEATREAAEAANRSKSEFLANMSHEIRTPMNAVLGLAQLLERDSLTSDQRDMVQRIRVAGNSLLVIINDLLDISKIEAGQLRIEMRPFRLSSLLEQMESILKSSISEKGLIMRIEYPTEVAGTLIGDDLRLGQVLLNLVGNSIKFTTHGEIRVRVLPLELSDAATLLRFEIGDTGIGIAPAALSTLFKPFTQADNSITRRFGGTGLGLSICKRLVELMGGTIGAESREGTGSTFWFEILFERMAADSPAVAIARQSLVTDGPRLTGKRILVVDDSDVNRIVVTRALALEGAETIGAIDGQQAVDYLRNRSRKFDLILMDVQMPVMDGLTATRILRCELGLTELPIIAFTAGVLQGERQKALDAGVNDVLPKPVELEAMVAKILHWTPSCGTEEVAPLAVMGGQSPAAPPEEQTGRLPERLPGLEIAKGIASLAVGETLYRELIGELVRIHGEDAVLIRGALMEGNLQQATGIAHTLKGVAGNLAAVTLFRIADELERALSQERPNLVNQLLLRLTEALRELHANALLLKVAPPMESTEPEPLPELTIVTQLLEELMAMLQQRRVAALTVMQQLEEQLSGTIVAAEVARLSAAVDRLEFVEAYGMAGNLADRLTETKTLSPVSVSVPPPARDR